MSVGLQQTQISQALRTALNLDAEAAPALEMEQAVVPVAIVADVRDLLDRNSFTVTHWSQLDPPVVAQFPYGVLEWLTAGPVKKVVVRGFKVFSGTLQTFFWGISQGGLPGTAFGNPRRKTSKLLLAPVQARAVSVANLVFPPTLVPSLSQAGILPANTMISEDFSDRPFILDTIGSSFIVGGGAANSTLYVSFDWEEFT